MGTACIAGAKFEDQRFSRPHHHVNSTRTPRLSGPLTNLHGVKTTRVATPLTKCKPCSKLESLTAECVTTGYKQLEYCTNVKKKKFVGCHYSPDFNEERLFWTFEILCGLAGAVAYWVVLTRRREIEKMVARRIQRQINA
eukprot:Em0009g1292a